MDAHATSGRAGRQIGADGRFVGLEDRFDDHVGWAYRLGMVEHWEVFRCELHAALTLVCRLDGVGIDPEDHTAVARLGQQHRDLELVLEQARATAEPTVDWRGCYETIWQLTDSVGLLGVAPGTPAPYGRAGTAELIDGLPDRMLNWLLRTTFLRDMTDVARTAPTGNWGRLAPVLQRQLIGAWALETRWMDQTDREHRERLATRRQQLKVLLATAREHFDPATDWESFREYLWLSRDRITVQPPEAA